MLVKEILPKVKANRNTFYNLDKQTKKDFQSLYSYLKRNENKVLNANSLKHIDAINWINKQNEVEYIRKFKAMQLITTNIKH